MKRGEIWWAVFPKPAGRRPVVLLSRDEAYQVRDLVAVVPVTTKMRGIPVEVRLGPDDGLPRDCVANADTLTTIPKACLSDRVSTLVPAKLAALNEAVKFALDIE